jgi:hypothetical protein
MSDQFQFCLPPKLAEDATRDRLSAQLRCAIAVFNTSPDPEERVEAINEIRRLRMLLNEGGAHGRGMCKPAHFTPGAIMNMPTFDPICEINHGSDAP